MNKKILLPFSVVLSLSFLLTSCIKEPDVILDTPSIVSESIIWSSDGNLSVTGSYLYSTPLQSIVFYVTNQKSYHSIINSAYAELTDDRFSVTLYNITHDSKYYYYYKLDTGNGFVLTDFKPFISSSN